MQCVVSEALPLVSPHPGPERNYWKQNGEQSRKYQCASMEIQGLLPSSTLMGASSPQEECGPTGRDRGGTDGERYEGSSDWTDPRELQRWRKTGNSSGHSNEWAVDEMEV